MGNRSSRRKPSKRGTMDTDSDEPEDISCPFDNLEGTTPDSYDKLLAWMIEMAENDDTEELQSPAFVEHLTTACAEKRNTLSPFNCAPLKQHSFDGPIRQHSYESSCSSRNSRSSRSRDDLLDPRTRFRRTMLSRQTTVDYSDDGDGTDAPMDISSGSSFDQDNEFDNVNPQSVLLQNVGETSFTNNRNMMPDPGKYSKTYQVLSNSVGDLIHGRRNMNPNTRKKSRSLMTVKRMMSETRNDDEITPISEETVVKILDDNLLDRNISDILYSVEALWPSRPK